MLRKGGLKEPTFTPLQAALLFPTSFHTDGTMLKQDAQKTYKESCEFDPNSQPQLVFPWAVQVSRAWATATASGTCGLLQALEPLHIYGPDFLEKRLRWRPSQPITIIELRVLKLLEPVVVNPQEKFWGCFSYVDLPLSNGSSFESLLAAAVPVLDDAAFAEKQRICIDGILNIPGLREVLPKPV